MTVKRRAGLIRVLTTTDTRLLNFHGEMVMKAFPGLEVFSACIPDQPEGVHDAATEKIAIPKVLALARKMENDGMEAVIVSCAGDPGVEQASAVLKIPVIGAGRAVASVARAFDLPVGVIGLMKTVPPAIRRILGDLLVAEIVPTGMVSTLDLMTLRGMSATIEAGYALKARGARVLALACTGLATIGAAEKLREALSMPVVDPVGAGGAVAWNALG